MFWPALILTIAGWGFAVAGGAMASSDAELNADDWIASVCVGIGTACLAIGACLWYRMGYEASILSLPGDAVQGG